LNLPNTPTITAITYTVTPFKPAVMSWLFGLVKYIRENTDDASFLRGGKYTWLPDLLHKAEKFKYFFSFFFYALSFLLHASCLTNTASPRYFQFNFLCRFVVNLLGEVTMDA